MCNTLGAKKGFISFHDLFVPVCIDPLAHRVSLEVPSFSSLKCIGADDYTPTHRGPRLLGIVECSSNVLYERQDSLYRDEIDGEADMAHSRSRLSWLTSTDIGGLINDKNLKPIKQLISSVEPADNDFETFCLDNTGVVHRWRGVPGKRCQMTKKF